MTHLWVGADPAAYPDANDYELGSRITVANTITLRQARVWSPGNTFPDRRFRVWNHANGQKLRDEAIPDTLQAGWNTVLLAAPLVLQPGDYVLSVPMLGYGLVGPTGALLSGDGNVSQVAGGIGLFAEDPGTMPFNPTTSFYGIDAEWEAGDTTAGNQPPTVSLAVDRSAGLVPHAVTVTATATDENVPGLTYVYDFGDGSAPVVGGTSATHTYTVAGLYTATVVVTDDGGRRGYDAVSVLVSPTVGAGAYDGAEQVLVTDWVKSRLLTDDAKARLNAISAGLADRVFEDFAPQGFDTYPFIIVQCQSPPRDVRGVGVSRVMVDTLYIVKAVAQVDSYAPLAPVARVVDAALTSATGGPVGTGDVFTSIRDEQFAMVEIENGKQYRHFGGVYKIQAQG